MEIGNGSRNPFPSVKFKIDLIIWKWANVELKILNWAKFKIDLIVWKYQFNKQTNKPQNSLKQT